MKKRYKSMYTELVLNDLAIYRVTNDKLYLDRAMETLQQIIEGSLENQLAASKGAALNE